MQLTNSSHTITPATTLGEIAGMPGFCQFGKLLFSCRPETWEHFCQLPIGILGSANGERAAKGLRHVQALLEQGFAFEWPLWPQEQIDVHAELADTRLFYFPGRPGAPFMLVIPGGGYQSVCTYMEGFPAASDLSSAGYHVFVLCYRVRQPKLMPKPIEDATQALRLILSRIGEIGADTCYGVMGFSAGGHLAAELCTDNFGVHLSGLPRPHATVLCYAALDLRTMTGNETAEKFRRMVANGDSLEDYCVNLHMDADFPPTILWQCEDDDTVNFQNLCLMDKRLTDLRVEHKAISYVRGGHGLSKDHDPEADNWIGEVLLFLKQYLPL